MTKTGQKQQVERLQKAIKALRESNLSERAKRRGIAPLEKALFRLVKEQG